MFSDFASIGTTEEEIDRELSRAKLYLFSKKGSAFLASMLSQTEFIWDKEIPTACTDGLEIRCNPEFFLNLPYESRATLLAHELWHIGYQHCLPDRYENREFDKWNIAADHVINISLHNETYSFIGLENCYRDHKFENMMTEQVYGLLPDEPKSDPKNPGKAKPDKMAGDLKPLDPDKAMDVMSKVVQAVQAARIADQAGDIPGEISLIVDHFLNPKLPWEVLLRRFFTEQANEDFSWKRPNRRYDDEYLPSLHSEDGLTTVNYYLDISGSVSDADILRFNSEVAHIKKEFNPEHLHLITFDTNIRNTYYFHRDDPFEKIIVTGRGGTDLRCVAKHIKKADPTVAVIFSDMFVDPMERVDVPLVWIVVGNPSAQVLGGKMIHIDNE